MKATHEGTCQICGRLQALPSGRLSKHGYDVLFHFFRGVCPGAGHKPLELERTLADEVATSLATQSRIHAKDATAAARGELLPKWAHSGKYERDSRGVRQPVVVPYEEALPEQQSSAVRALVGNLNNMVHAEAHAAVEIRARADRVTGKQKLIQRGAKEDRKVLAPGVKFKLFGKERVALRIEYRTAFGIGPGLNGRVMQHVVYQRDDGKLSAYPTRLIRQSAIL